jgi:hypothetical protein
MHKRFFLLSISLLFVSLLVIGVCTFGPNFRPTSSEVAFSSFSPVGEGGGSSLPASCESNYQHDASDCTVSVSASPNPITTPGGDTTKLSWTFNQYGPSTGYMTSYLAGGWYWDQFMSPYSCTITGPGGKTVFMNGAVTGSMDTPVLTDDTTYQVTCRSLENAPHPQYNYYDYPSGPYTVRVSVPKQCSCNSVPNSCGMTNPGLIRCGSTAACPVPAPNDNVCANPAISIGLPGGTPVTTGGPTGGTPSGGGTPTTGTTPTDPPVYDQTVPKGGTCTIQWDATPATKCRITGPGVSQNVGVSGTFTTPRIGVDTVGSAMFTLTCYNGNTVASYANFACRLPAVIKETN